MNDTGPDAVPPPASSSFDERIGDRLRAGARSELEQHALGPRQRQDRVHRVLDRVDEAGRALRRLLEAAVEPDRAVERRLLVDEDVLQVVAERLQVLVAREVLLFAAPTSVIVSTTRPISCLTLRSRSGVPIWPRKYFETTMLVACCDQDFGISTSRCSKTTSPRSLPMTRRAQLPLDLVERIDAGFGEEARERQPGHGGRRPRLRARLVRLDETAAPQPFHCFRPSAGRHLRPGRQRPLSSRPLRFIPGSRPGSRRSPPAPEATVVAVLENRGRSSRRKPAAHCTRSWEAPRSFALSRYGGPICAWPATFVKRVNTTYCAFLLGHSQDVDACACGCRQAVGAVARLGQRMPSV